MKSATGFILLGLALTAGSPAVAQQPLRGGMSADAFIWAYYSVVRTPLFAETGTRRVYLNASRVPLYHDYAMVCRAIAAGNAVGVRSGLYRTAGPTYLPPVEPAVLSVGGFSWLAQDKTEPALATDPPAGESPTCGTKISSLTTVEKIGGYDYMGTQGNRIIYQPWYRVNRLYLLRGNTVVAGYVVGISLHTCLTGPGQCTGDTPELRARYAERRP